MSKEETYPEDSLRMVLIGKTGVGKSAAGNTILMRKGFYSTSCASSLTKVCKRESGKVQGQILEVVDTPGLFDTELSQEQVKAEIAKCIIYASPGPHVFLIILKADRFTKEEQDTVKILQKLFGEQAARYTMALFTRGDDLEADGVDIETVIGENKVLSDFLHQCKGGYHVFNNRNPDPAQVHELLKKINTIVERNGGRYYTNKMFQEAEKAVEEKMNELLKKSNTRVEGNPRSYYTNKKFPGAGKLLMDEPHFDSIDERSEAKELVAANAHVHLAVLGASVGGAIGASVGAAVGGVGAAIGAPIGAVVGAIGGFVAEECVIQ